MTIVTTIVVAKKITRVSKVLCKDMDNSMKDVSSRILNEKQSNNYVCYTYLKISKPSNKENQGKNDEKSNSDLLNDTIYRHSYAPITSFVVHYGCLPK